MELPQISSVILADSDGREFMILCTDNGWLTHNIDVMNNAAQARWQRLSAESNASESWDESLEYDSRERPWFRGTVNTGAPDQLFSTEPYRFFSTKTPGITASTSWPSAADANKNFVPAFDVLLTSISEVTRQLHAGETDKTFVFTGAAR